MMPRFLLRESGSRIRGSASSDPDDCPKKEAVVIPFSLALPGKTRQCAL